MGAKSDHLCLFSAYFGVFSPDLWMEYRIFISIVDISANLENIAIDIDKAILKISISIRRFWKISISIRIFWKISILPVWSPGKEAFNIYTYHSFIIIREVLILTLSIFIAL